MKKLPFGLTALALVSLAACSSNTPVTYSLRFDATDAPTMQILTDASVRVIERRVDHLGLTLASKATQSAGSGALVTIEVDDPAAIPTLTGELTEPFNMKVMREVTGSETADITVEGHGGFKDTGINQSDLLWVDSRADEEGKGEVRLVFTDAGRAKLNTLFKQVNGKNIGLFVRDKLVSKLHVGTDVVPENIVIRGIPTAEVAQVFADDMNVGLHVTFTQVP